ncbi:MAG: hypothetical protein HYX50_00710 [Chloroflexi bacterium]|nr:hypothetical protein [Chloroflexota bacterium]
MPKRDDARDPYERMVERIASVAGPLRALAQPDRSAIRGVLEQVAAEYSARGVTVPASRLTTRGLANADPRSCAVVAANNLDQLVTEKSGIPALPQEQRADVTRMLSKLVPLVAKFRSAQRLPFDAEEKLRLARSTFLMNFG